MKASDIPTKIPTPWGASAGGSFIRVVPIPSQISVQNGAASWVTGFPPLNFLPVSAGGVPPFGEDVNGALNQISAWSRWQNAGTPVPYDAGFAAAIGGYPKGSLVASVALFGIIWQSLADDNTDDPDAANTTWQVYPGQAKAKYTAIANLAEFMTQVYGSGWTYYTAPHTGTDAGPAIDAAGAWLRTNYGRGIIYIPPGGAFRIVTAPNHTNLNGNIIEGGGSQATEIVFDNDTDALFNFTGAAGFTGGGLRNMVIALDEDHATSTAQLLVAAGDATYQPSSFVVSNLYCTNLGTSQWYNGFVFNGLARTTPQGLREVDVRNINIFQCRNTGLQIFNVVQGQFSNIGVYGITPGADVAIGGGGSALLNSTGITVDNLVCTGLTITECSSIWVRGHCQNFTTNPTLDFYNLSLVISGVNAGTPGIHGTFTQP